MELQEIIVRASTGLILFFTIYASLAAWRAYKTRTNKRSKL